MCEQTYKQIDSYVIWFSVYRYLFMSLFIGIACYSFHAIWSRFLQRKQKPFLTSPTLIYAGSLVFSSGTSSHLTKGRALYLGIDPHHWNGNLTRVEDYLLFDLPLVILMVRDFFHC